MNLVIAIIQPTKLQAVKDALAKIEVTRMTVCDAQGYGRQRGHTTSYRGHEYRVDLLSKVELQILVNDDFLDRAVECLIQLARTGAEGNIGDSKIFVLPALEAIRISDMSPRQRSRLSLPGPNQGWTARPNAGKMRRLPAVLSHRSISSFMSSPEPQSEAADPLCETPSLEDRCCGRGCCERGRIKLRLAGQAAAPKEEWIDAVFATARRRTLGKRQA